VIRQGRLLAVGSPAQLREQDGGEAIEVWGEGFSEEVLSALRGQPGVLDVEAEGSHLVIRVDGRVDVAAINRALVLAGAAVSEIRRGRASLEDVFLTLVREDQAEKAK